MGLAVRLRGADYNLLISPRGGFRAENGGVQPAWCPLANGEIAMNLPKIDISALPDLDVLTGVFGSLKYAPAAMASDDTVIILMVFVYDATNG
jgi:hypothetical protein